MRIGLYILQPYAVDKKCTFCHVSEIKWRFHMHELFSICFLMLKFLMYMQCERLSAERKCCHLQLEHAQNVKYCNFSG